MSLSAKSKLFCDSVCQIVTSTLQSIRIIYFLCFINSEMNKI